MATKEDHMTHEKAEKLAERLYWAIPFNREKLDHKRLFVQEITQFIQELQRELNS